MQSSSQHYEVITFDCFGTLIDWDRGIANAFVEAAGREGVTLDPASVVSAYDNLERVVQAQTFRRYRDVLADTAQRAANAIGWKVTPQQAGFLVESLPDWPPFDDTNPALKRLSAAGYKLGILSNTDDDLLALTCKQLSAPFEILITAEQVRSYKPAHGHFLAARGKVSGRPWLHVAQSYFHDIEPALTLAIPVAWINRKNRPLLGPPPLREFRVLTELADWLAPN
jgi:2-haloalkanoic acid dehalogenase type II